MGEGTQARRHAGTKGWVVLAALVLSHLMLGACGGPKNFLNENDELRRQNLELAEQVRAMQQRIDRQIDNYADLEDRVRADEVVIAGAEAPRLSEVRFARYSAALDTDDDGADDLIRVYLHTLDQMGRFMPVAGLTQIRAVRMLPDRDPQTMAERTYQPEDFDKAYHSGLTGTHYTLELQLPSPLPDGLDMVAATVFVKDATTGLTHSQTQAMAIRRRNTDAK